MKNFYRIYAAFDNDCLADTGVPEQTFEVPRDVKTDREMVDRAYEMANKLVVGEEGRRDFVGYCVYVTYGNRITSDLIGTAERRYSFDRREDYTIARGHGGRVPGYWRQSTPEE